MSMARMAPDGDRLVLLTEDLFMTLVEQHMEATGQELEVVWGDPIFASHTYYSPTVYVMEDEEAAPEPVG